MATYDRIGHAYTQVRRPDPRIAALITEALGDAETVVNVGAGAGSYEPRDRWLLAVEPSEVMIAQRPPGSAPAVVGTAEDLPLADRQVDAAMSVLSLHHWRDWRLGLAELRRVAADRLVLFSWSPERGDFWLLDDYFPEVGRWDATRFPRMDELLGELPGAHVEPVPIPRDCQDGFLAAWWARPDAFLSAAVQRSNSFFALADPDLVRAGLDRLRRDLDDGTWHARHSQLLERDSIDAGYFLLTAGL